MLRSLLLIAALAVASAGCCCSPIKSAALTDTLALQSQNPRWVTSSAQPPRGTALILHGLNLRPSSMDEIAEHVASLGLDTYRLSLAGHADAPAPAITTAMWENDLAEAFALAKQRQPGKPIYILGYSIGGLLAVHFVSRHPEIQPHAMILLAPALSLKLIAQSIALTSLFPESELALPSLSPPHYRRLPGTPLRWYNNLRTMLNEISPLSQPGKLALIPTLVLGNPRDELVSLTGIQSWIEDNSLSDKWCVAKLYPSHRNPALPEHLVIDRASLGAEQWIKLTSLITLGFSESSQLCP